jgi:hypothetical protein
MGFLIDAKTLIFVYKEMNEDFLKNTWKKRIEVLIVSILVLI